MNDPAYPNQRPSLVPSYLRAAPAVPEPPASEPQARALQESVRESTAPVAVELLWMDPQRAGSVRALALGAAVQGAGSELLDRWLDPADADAGARQRSDVHKLLARGKPADPDTLREAMLFAFEDGTGAAPTAIVAGELHLPLDELAHLEAVLSYAAPLAPLDQRVHETVQHATAASSNRKLTANAATHWRVRLEEALRASGRWEPGYERVVVENRQYVRRSVLGGAKIRATLSTAGDATPLPCYLPEAAAADLPLHLRFPARLLVEVRPQQDPGETNGLALLVMALGRVV